jgi:preprotein translocase subunit SecD
MNSTMPNPRRPLIVLLLLVAAMAAAVFGAGRTTPELGLDLAGGTTVTLKAMTANGRTPPADQMEESAAIMNERVNALGVSEAQVTRQGGDMIVVQVPGQGQNRVVGLIETTAKLQFRQVYAERPAADSSVAGVPDQAVIAQYQRAGCSTDHTLLSGAADENRPWVAACDKNGRTAYLLGPVRVQGEQIKSAQAVAPDPQSGRAGWSVSLAFKARGAGQFYNVTRDAYTAFQSDPASPRQQVAIVLDGRVVSAPAIDNGAISGGLAEINGNAESFSQQYAGDLAKVLEFGALPLNFKQSAESSVSPELGGYQLRAGLEAGGIGLALVVLYCLAYYRALGLVAICSLLVSGLLTYLSVILLGHAMDFRLSLAGIAGLIVAIGITADSFVVYFERLRDEVREGRSLRTAAERGWQRARRTILVADAVSFICAFVLYVTSIGSVQGFAFTLGLTTLIDVVVVFLFSKPMVSILAGSEFFANTHRLSGLAGLKERSPRMS